MVDWQVDVEELRLAKSPDTPPYPVVRVGRGGPAGPTEWHEANAIIFRAFTELNGGANLEDSHDSNADIIQR